MIRLYIFFSKLEKHFSTLALELNTWNPPADMTTLQNSMWRSPDRTNKRRRTGSINRSGGGREGGNHNGPVEADGVDDDMNIMNWRDQVVKDGQGRVVSDEDNILDATSDWFEGSPPTS